jgi:hypothetical protein
MHNFLFIQENMLAWLTDDRGRDQFVIRFGSDTEVYWNDHRQGKPDPVYQRQVLAQATASVDPISRVDDLSADLCPGRQKHKMFSILSIADIEFLAMWISLYQHLGFLLRIFGTLMYCC